VLEVKARVHGSWIMGWDGYSGFFNWVCALSSRGNVSEMCVASSATRH